MFTLSSIILISWARFISPEHWEEAQDEEFPKDEFDSKDSLKKDESTGDVKEDMKSVENLGYKAGETQ